MQMNPCGCYFGRDCTKTTVCRVDAAIEDKKDEIRLDVMVKIDDTIDALEQLRNYIEGL